MNKKLCFVLKGYPRVSETFIAQEIYLLEQKGYKIEILSMRRAREAKRQPLVEQIKAEVIYLHESVLTHLGDLITGNIQCLLRYPWLYFKGLSSGVFRSFVKKSKEPIKRFFQGSWVVGRYPRFDQSYHFHSHFIHGPTLLTNEIVNYTKASYSISAHAKDIYTIPQQDVVDRCNRSKFLTTCTRFNYNFLRSLPGIDQEKIFLSYHGIDTDTFNPSSIKCIEEGHPLRLVSVARLVGKKGYDTILESLKILKDQNFDFQYDIFGGGELKHELLDLVTTLGLETQVIFHDTKTHPEIISRFKKKGVFLCGSKIVSSGDRDGIPNTLAEAMSMELAVVATDVSGIPELIEDRITGRLVPSNNPPLMAKAILELAENPNQADEMARRGRKRILEVFNAHVCINNVEKLIRACLNSEPLRRREF